MTTVHSRKNVLLVSSDRAFTIPVAGHPHAFDAHKLRPPKVSEVLSIERFGPPPEEEEP